MNPSFSPPAAIAIDQEPTVVLRHAATNETSSDADSTASGYSYDAARDGLDGVDLDEIEVIRGSYQKIKSFGLPLKIHLALGVAVCIICMLIWHWQGPPICSVPVALAAPIMANVTEQVPTSSPEAQSPTTLPPNIPTSIEVVMPKFWWFFYPFLAFAFTVTSHNFFSEGKYERIGVTFVIVLNLTLFLTWAFRMPLGNTVDCTKNVGPDGFFFAGDTFTAPWPIFPLAITAVVGVAVHYLRQPKEQRKWFRLLLNEYWIINGSFFLIWLFYGQGHPWWIYPLFALALPVVIYRMRYIYKETRVWAYVAVFAIDLNLILFLAWIFTPSSFPWPLIVAGVSGAGVWYLMRREAKPAVPVTAAWENKDAIPEDTPTV
eukprot:TRINITY_DN15067_c0_g1_i1.p1 TRINITY_DN15067_c0_g1~~TRINITY_DN15067_c0_g1_i1.p1  ORF type:complete len:375 (+),score=49.87 TRINITY_DN15067_c0_g1_i1:14-1138(+)